MGFHLSFPRYADLARRFSTHGGVPQRGCVLGCWSSHPRGDDVPFPLRYSIFSQLHILSPYHQLVTLYITRSSNFGVPRLLLVARLRHALNVARPALSSPGLSRRSPSTRSDLRGTGHLCRGFIISSSSWPSVRGHHKGRDTHRGSRRGLPRRHAGSDAIDASERGARRRTSAPGRTEISARRFLRARMVRPSSARRFHAGLNITVINIIAGFLIASSSRT